MSAGKETMSIRTVDIDEMMMWAQGILLDFKNGKGRYVDERRCSEAEAALKCGEEVICMRGNALTGTKLVAVEKEFHEISCTG